MNAKYDRKGLVLIVVLWVVVLLGVIVAIVSRSTRLDAKVSYSAAEAVRLKWACRAGVDTAIGVLNDDLKASDSLDDLWSFNEDDFNDVVLKGCLFNVRVVDEAGKLNVNTATKDQLLELPLMTEEIAGAIIDWRDKNDDSGRTGAEEGYYENLRYRYNIRNGPFRTIRELLMVKDVTEELLYGEDTNFNGELDYNEKDGAQSPPADNTDDKLDEGWLAYLSCYSYDKNSDAYGNKRVNINEADESKLEKDLKIRKSYAKWIVDNRKKKYKSIADLINNKSPKKAKKKSDKNSKAAKPLDLRTFSDIADKITITKDEKIHGRVNINTAPKIVLAALLGGGQSDDQIAEDIITYREGLTDGMQSIADVMKVESVNINKFKKIANSITTRSDVFTIYCSAMTNTGAAGGAILKTEAVVDRNQMPCEILYWYQGANN